MLLVKNPPANAGDIGDTGSISGLGRSPGGGNGNPLQYPCLENPMDRGAWRATVYGVAKRWTRLSIWATHTYFFWASLMSQTGKNLPAIQADQSSIPGIELPCSWCSWNVLHNFYKCWKFSVYFMLTAHPNHRRDTFQAPIISESTSWGHSDDTYSRV